MIPTDDDLLVCVPVHNVTGVGDENSDVFWLKVVVLVAVDVGLQLSSCGGVVAWSWSSPRLHSPLSAEHGQICACTVRQNVQSY